ncbi:MAG: FKBP-type peptidyl-prolyl cis-trans isomerase [Myxococcales bacterium]|nr:FKBP-type peptidyl-prolyl cis-trans isomerase [Myxococcales bacterium]
MVTIAAHKVAFIHYTLTNDDGDEIDTSRGGEPMPYLHGADNIVPGLERQLEGRRVGDRFEAVVDPEDGYGSPSGRPLQPVPLEAFEGVEPQPGMPLVVENDDGEQLQFWIDSVSDEAVMLTADHPLAGVTLHFDVEVIEIRDATPAELEHGHAHSGDGHHHHH